MSTRAESRGAACADRAPLAVRTARAARPDGGQATVELALSLPVVALMLCAVLQVAVIARDRVAVHLAAREAARAAAVAADPAAAGRVAADQATSLRPLRVTITRSGGLVTAEVAYTDGTEVPLIGALLPDVEVTAAVTMALEPP